MIPYSGNAYAGRLGEKNQDELKKLVSTGSKQQLSSREAVAPTLNNIDNALGRNDSKGKESVEDSSPAKAVEVTLTELDIAALGEELEKALSELTIRDGPSDKEIAHNTKLVKAYLLKNEPEFERVMEFRHRGWINNKDLGDAHFKVQRARADNADYKSEGKFHNMMIEIAAEMQCATGGLTPLAAYDRTIKVFDICMAPGGYSEGVLSIHRDAKIFAVTLDLEAGGHPILIPKERLNGIQYADVTMLVSEFTKGTNNAIPQNHGDKDKFDTRRIFGSHKMDLVMCDGMVLRNHKRGSYREKNEPLRLAVSQIILGLQRLETGGNLIILLHKIDSWPSVKILHAFSKFSKVQVFKPARKHSTRSSYYMVATEIDVESPAAIAAIADWKDEWYEATFGGNKVSDRDEKLVLRVLKEFGPMLIELGRPIWWIQADALSKTVYAGGMIDSSVGGEEKPISPQKDV